MMRSKENPGRFLDLGDFSGLEAFGADVDPLGDAVQFNSDLLEIGKEGSKRFADDFGARPAFSADHTAALVFAPGGRTFTADFACFRHMRKNLSSIQIEF